MKNRNACICNEAVIIRCVKNVGTIADDLVELSKIVLNNISNRIMTEIVNVTRVVYDVSSKNHSTIEWE